MEALIWERVVGRHDYIVFPFVMIASRSRSSDPDMGVRGACEGESEVRRSGIPRFVVSDRGHDMTEDFALGRRFRSLDQLL